MSAFDEAWSVLKALEEQQMFGATMHPAIQGMLARRGRYPGSFGHHLEGGAEYVDTDEGTVPVNFRAPEYFVRVSNEIEPSRVAARKVRGSDLGHESNNPRRFQGDLDPRQMRRGSVFSRIGEQGRPEVFKMAPMMGCQMPKEDNGVEEYSHKDLDPEALIDFLVETLKMPYRDAKALTMSHKTKELVEANHRKGKLAARNQSGEAPMQGGY